MILTRDIIGDKLTKHDIRNKLIQIENEAPDIMSELQQISKRFL